MRIHHRSFLFYALLLLVVIIFWLSYQLYHLNSENKSSEITAKPEIFNDTLVVFISEIPNRFNPYTVIYDEDVFVLKQIYRGLTKINYNLIEVPDLAEYWEISPDRHTYYFHLHKDLYFHDGSKLTIDDFIKSVEYFIRNYPENYSIAYFYIIEGLEEFLLGQNEKINGIEKINDFEVAITLKRPYVPFPKLLSLPQMSILPQKSLNKNPKSLSRFPVGNGPYKLIDKGKDYIILEAFKNNKIFKPLIKYYKFMSIRNGKNEKNDDYLKQNFDLTIHPRNQFFEKPIFLNYRSTSTYNLVFLGMNCELYPTNLIDVRRAIFYGMKHGEDTEEYQRRVKPVEFFSPILLPHDSVEKTIISSNLTKAKNILHKDTISQKKYSISMILDTADYRPIYAREFSSLGDSLNFFTKIKFINGMDMKYRHQIFNGVNVFIFDWQLDLPDPEFFFDLLFRSNSPMNLFNYENLEVDSLLDLAKFQGNSTIRNQIYAQIESKIISDAPIRPIIYYRDFLFHKDYLKGAQLSRLGIASLELDKIYVDKDLYRKHHWKTHY